jgi:hypothetical protein
MRHVYDTRANFAPPSLELRANFGIGYIFTSLVCMFQRLLEVLCTCTVRIRVSLKRFPPGAAGAHGS